MRRSRPSFYLRRRQRPVAHSTLTHPLQSDRINYAILINAIAKLHAFQYLRNVALMREKYEAQIRLRMFEIGYF